MKASRLRLRNWIELARIRRKFSEEGADVSELMFDALSLSSAVSDEDRELPWYETAEVFTDLVSQNNVTVAFPILQDKTEKKDKEAPWEYEGRDWYFWVHIFASNYGWGLDTVSELDVDDAFGLLQEIRVVEQLDREWEHSLTEIAYPYNEATKKSVYKPIKRPKWMAQSEVQAGGLRINADRVGKFPKKFVPPGITVKSKIDENENTESSAGI